MPCLGRFPLKKKQKQVQEDFEECFGKPATSKSNLHLWEKKAFQIGSVLDSKHSRRPKIRYYKIIIRQTL